jgi:hypothetical protein
VALVFFICCGLHTYRMTAFSCMCWWWWWGGDAAVPAATVFVHGPLFLLLHTMQSGCNVGCVVQAPGDEPVWRQLLRCYLDDSDPNVAQQAAAALAQ